MQIATRVGATRPSHKARPSYNKTDNKTEPVNQQILLPMIQGQGKTLSPIRIFRWRLLRFAMMLALVMGLTAVCPSASGTAISGAASTGTRAVPVDVEASRSDTSRDPEQVVAAYLEAFRQKQWTRCANLMHPGALQALKDALVDAVAQDSTSGLPGALYGEGAPRETIRFAPPHELYARMLQVVYERTPEAKRVLDGFSAHVIGSVNESDRITHVVARTSVSGSSDITQVEVFSVQKTDGIWRMRLTTDIKDVAEAISD